MDLPLDIIFYVQQRLFEALSWCGRLSWSAAHGMEDLSDADVHGSNQGQLVA